MASLEESLKDIAVSKSLGVYPPTAFTQDDWVVIIGRMTDINDQVICIAQTGGKPSNPKWNIDYPSVQFRIRGKKDGSFITTKQKAIDVKNAFLGLPSQDINGDRLTAINAIGDVTPLGYDANDRPMFAVNFTLIFEPTVMGNRSPGT